MKGQKLIPLLSILIALPVFAQQNQVNQLDKAKETIASADATYEQRESEVLDAAPELPSEPVFEVPSDQVFLDLPGDNEGASSVSVDAETISVDFPEEDVRDIIRSVAELYELNVVIPDSLAGSVSIKLRDVTWQQVFDVVLEPLNYTYIFDGNIIKIKSQDELAVEPVDTRVFIVDFSSAEEIRASIGPLIDESAGGKVQVDKRSNALVITERPSRMNDIQEIIETLDRPTEQVMIESKFIEISNRDSSKLGIDWKTMDAWELSLGDTGTSGPDDGITVDYEEAVGNLDLKTAVFSAGRFSTVISALGTYNDLELVSNPTVVTVNNSPAKINIGIEYPIPSFQYNDEVGQMEVNGFEYKPIGINLDVTPQINSAGFINLDILPEISTLFDTVDFESIEIPIISTRKTKSRVTIKSGYTLAIGGLMEQREASGRSSIPVLGDIPVLGRLFSRDTGDSESRNLIVFITAKILSASGATYEDVFSQKDLYEMGVSPRDVPGFEPNEEEIQMYDNFLRSEDDLEKLQKELELKQKIEQVKAAKEVTNLNMQAQEKKEAEPNNYPKRNFN
jgi:type IV pilus assembly protein PilQ